MFVECKTKLVIYQPLYLHNLRPANCARSIQMQYFMELECLSMRYVPLVMKKEKDRVKTLFSFIYIATLLGHLCFMLRFSVYTISLKTTILQIQGWQQRTKYIIKVEIISDSSDTNHITVREETIQIGSLLRKTRTTIVSLYYDIFILRLIGFIKEIPFLEKNYWL